MSEDDRAVEIAEGPRGGTEYAWLIEENSGGFVHWIKLAEDEWPKTKVTTRRARMNSDHDVEVTTYRTPVVRTKDASEAIRFARKQDAEAFLRLFDRFLLRAFATEHGWDQP